MLLQENAILKQDKAKQLAANSTSNGSNKPKNNTIKYALFIFIGNLLTVVAEGILE